VGEAFCGAMPSRFVETTVAPTGATDSVLGVLHDWTGLEDPSGVLLDAGERLSAARAHTAEGAARVHAVCAELIAGVPRFSLLFFGAAIACAIARCIVLAWVTRRNIARYVHGK
jgi:hypothetical protein